MNKIGLPRGIIEKYLLDEEERESLDKILTKLDPNKKFHLSVDRERLEELFLAINPQKLGEKQFRITILKEASDALKLEFIKKRKLADVLPINKIELDRVIEKAASFPWSNNNETKEFIETFNLDPSIIPFADSEELLIETIPKSEQTYELLLDYQTDIYYRALDELISPSKRFIIQLPTGAGKTRVAMEIAARMINTREKCIVIWLADRTELCRQAVDSFKNIWPHVGSKDIALYRIWEDRSLPERLEGPALIVSTTSKMLTYMRDNKGAVKGDLIIFDEAHHAPAPEYKKLILHLSRNQARAIGLTATPGRSLHDEEENRKLATLFHDTILKINSGEQGAIEYLQEKKVLAKAIRMPPIVFNDPDFHLTETDWKKLAKDSDYDIAFLKRIGRSYLRNLTIAQEVKKIGDSGKRVLYFGTDVAQSRLMFAVAKYFGFSAAHIEAGTPMSYRRDMIKKFMNGEIKFIFNFDIFSTGFDAKKVDVIFIARPTKSPILLLQMIGRGMRGPLMGGNESFELLYVKDEFLNQFTNLDDLFELFDEYFGERN